MTYTLLIALNLALSILAMLIVAGCVALTARLRTTPAHHADANVWADPLPLWLAASQRNAAKEGKATAYPHAA